jgi:hypothetical protein
MKYVIKASTRKNGKSRYGELNRSILNKDSIFFRVKRHIFTKFSRTENEEPNMGLGRRMGGEGRGEGRGSMWNRAGSYGAFSSGSLTMQQGKSKRSVHFDFGNLS